MCAFTSIHRKKGYTLESRMAAIVLGLKKARRERGEEIKQESSRQTSVYVYVNEYLSLVLIRNYSIDNDNKVNQWKVETNSNLRF